MADFAQLLYLEKNKFYFTMVSTPITIRTATAISITVPIIIILLSRQIFNIVFCSAGRPSHSSALSIPVIQPQDNPTDKAYAVIVQLDMFVPKIRYRRRGVVVRQHAGSSPS
jgi:hypothetical protein